MAGISPKGGVIPRSLVAGTTGFWQRWRILIAVGFVLSTMLGGLGESVVTVNARPPDHASVQDEAEIWCQPVHACMVAETMDAAPGADPEPEPISAPAPDPTSGPDSTAGPDPTAAPHPTRDPKPTSDPAPAIQPEPTAQPQPTSEPEPTNDPAPTSAPADDGAIATMSLWLSHAQIRALPTSGASWGAVLDDATGDWGVADVQDQNSRHNTRVFAGALVAVRLNDAAMRARVVEALATVPGTEQGGRTLALGRNLAGYVLAADLVGYRDPVFVSWVDRVRDTELDGHTLISTHEQRPNNWGTHAGASRIAAARYLGDTADLKRAAQVFRGWLGDRDAYAGFRYGDLDWQCDPDRPVGINPAGCTIDGHDVGGVLPDDQRRGGEFTWPPPQVNYAWGALQGAVVQAELLSRAGYDAWSWSDRALVRALEWLHTEADFPAVGDDTWIPSLVNHATGTSYPAIAPSRHGKNLGYTDWTHR
jgi:hypothetical protein